LRTTGAQDRRAQLTGVPVAGVFGWSRFHWYIGIYPLLALSLREFEAVAGWEAVFWSDYQGWLNLQAKRLASYWYRVHLHLEAKSLNLELQMPEQLAAPNNTRREFQPCVPHRGVDRQLCPQPLLGHKSRHTDYSQRPSRRTQWFQFGKHLKASADDHNFRRLRAALQQCTARHLRRRVHEPRERHLLHQPPVTSVFIYVVGVRPGSVRDAHHPPEQPGRQFH